jgi:hypothetical protein
MRKAKVSSWHGKTVLNHLIKILVDVPDRTREKKKNRYVEAGTASCGGGMCSY